MSLYIPPRPAVRPALKAGPTGPGSSVLITEFPLSIMNGQQTPQAKMAQAWKLGIEVPWIRAAERAISGKVQGLEWHLEDGDGDTVDDTYTGTDAQEAKTLIEKPQAAIPIGNKMFRTDLWRLTERHVGLCGNGFWYLDQLNAFGIPAGILYIRPDRMTPDEDNNGNLTGWRIDKTATNPGIAVSLEEIIHFVLDPPDIGHFGIGLVESAMNWLTSSQGLDRHINMLIGSGGRLSGFLAPKTGVVGAEQSLAMERDWRTVVDQSDAAKRLQIVNAPVDFTKTTLTPQELLIVDLLKNRRDSILGLWGVPIAKLGIHERGSAMSAGAARVTDSDDETLWNDAVKPRLESFREHIQYRLIDPYLAMGTKLTFVLEYPSFDDDSPRYTAAQQAVAAPLTNNQRLEILGRDPIDDAIIGQSGGPLGMEIWLPNTQVYAYTAAPGIDNKPPAPPPALALNATSNPGESTEPMTPGASAAGETSATPKKAAYRSPAASRLGPDVAPLHAALVGLRQRIEAAKTPILRRSVSAVLQEQRHEIADRLRKNADHIAKNRSDTSVWFPAKQFDAALSRALAPHLDVMASSVNAHINDVLPAKKAAPAHAVERVLARGAARVTGINKTTRDKINEAIIRGLDNGSTIDDVAAAIEAGDPFAGLDLAALFDEYRSEMIARTELMDAYNASALASYTDAGIEYVQAIDGDFDEACRERDGEIFRADDAGSIEDHPNGTLDWVPMLAQDLVGEEVKAAVASPITVNVHNHLPELASNVTLPEMSPVFSYTEGIHNVTSPAVSVAAPIINVAAPVMPEPIVVIPPAAKTEKTVKKNYDGSYTVTER